MKFNRAGIGALLSAAVIVVILSGCHAYAKLYPIAGPLARQTPPPVFRVLVTGGLSLDHLSAGVADQEHLACDFSRFHWEKSAAFPGTFDYKQAWNAVYGDKFFEGHILGADNPYYWCDGKGDKGTVFHAAIQVDMAKDESRSQGVKGVLSDDKGNIYKIAF